LNGKSSADFKSEFISALVVNYGLLFESRVVAISDDGGTAIVWEQSELHVLLVPRDLGGLVKVPSFSVKVMLLQVLQEQDLS